MVKKEEEVTSKIRRRDTEIWVKIESNNIELKEIMFQSCNWSTVIDHLDHLRINVINIQEFSTTEYAGQLGNNRRKVTLVFFGLANINIPFGGMSSNCWTTRW